MCTLFLGELIGKIIKMQDLLYKYRKVIIVLGIVFFLTIIGISVYNIVWNNINSAYLSVTVLPSAAKVRVGNRWCQSSGECRMAPGEYDVEISSEGFITQKFSMTIGEGYADGNFIMLYLEPEEWNADWYEKNLNDDEKMVMGAITYQNANEKLKEIKKENPELETLPISVEYFTSDYSKKVHYFVEAQLNKDGTDFDIIITDYTGGNYEDALSKLRARGIDIKKYNIEYSDLSSDFEWGHAI